MSVKSLISSIDNMTGDSDKHMKLCYSELEELKKSVTRLYHVTKKEKLNGIASQGLKPMIGDNSKIAVEDKERVYLTDYYSLPYWIIMLDGDTVLTIDDIETVDCEEFCYSDYSEYYYYDTISSDRMSILNSKIDLYEPMRKFCKSMLYDISVTTLIFAKYYNGQRDKVGVYNTLLHNLHRADFSVLSKEEIREELVELGRSGEYTFCDTYLGTEERMYEQLIAYSEDEYTELRTELYNYIIKTFDGCLDVDTGGWLG